MTWEQWTFSLGAIPVSLIVLRNVLWRFGCTNSGSKILFAFGLGACLLCIALAVIWQVHTANADWAPPQDDQNEVGGLILWTLYWNAVAGFFTALGIRVTDILIIERTRRISAAVAPDAA